MAIEATGDHVSVAVGHDTWRRVARRVVPDGRLVRWRSLTGGVSAEITALEISRPDGDALTLVVRRHGEADRSRNPHIARDEFTLLNLLRAQGLPVPRPWFVDELGEPLATPYVVVEFVPGEPTREADDPGQVATVMADRLAEIHQITDLEAFGFLPPHVAEPDDIPAMFDDSMDEARIRSTLAASTPRNSGNQPVLLHGDYWPGNILWRDGVVTAIIDWEDAAVGDPLADVANCRLELLWLFDAQAMTTFTERYLARSRIDFRDLSVWDLRAALRPCGKISTWGLPHETERRMRTRHHEFVAQALRMLGG